MQGKIFHASAKKVNFKSGLFASCAMMIAACLVSVPAFAQNQIASLSSISDAVNNRPTLSENDKERLKAAVYSSLRIEADRDKYRHPTETLEFFGIKSDATVVEVWPGQGWYTSIIAPYLKSGGGHFIAANYDASTSNSDVVNEFVNDFNNRFVTHPELYGDVKQVPFGPNSQNFAPDNSVDAVVTFRNINNWISQGWSDKAFQDFYKALKPGGILGIEENRQDDDVPQDPLAADGYVRQDYVISLAKDAGFELVATSEINANPNDTKDYPFGVWTLPPVLRSAPAGQANNPKFNNSKYKQIGESDRMTLVFRKPLNASTTSRMAEVSQPTPVPVIFKDKKPKKSTKKLRADNKPKIVDMTADKGKNDNNIVDAAPTNTIAKPVTLKHAENKTKPASEKNDIGKNIAVKSDDIKAESKNAAIPILPTLPPVDNKAAVSENTNKVEKAKAEIKPKTQTVKTAVEPKAEEEKPAAKTTKTVSKKPVQVKKEVPAKKADIKEEDKKEAAVKTPAKAASKAKTRAKIPAKEVQEEETATKAVSSKKSPVKKSSTKAKASKAKAIEEVEDNKTDTKTKAPTKKSRATAKTAPKKAAVTKKAEVKAKADDNDDSKSKSVKSKTVKAKAAKPKTETEKPKASAKKAVTKKATAKNKNIPDWNPPKKKK